MNLLNTTNRDMSVCKKYKFSAENITNYACQKLNMGREYHCDIKQRLRMIQQIEVITTEVL